MVSLTTDELEHLLENVRVESVVVLTIVQLHRSA